MIKSMKNIYSLWLFILLQSIFVSLDAFYAANEDGFSAGLVAFLLMVVVSIILLMFRFLFEVRLLGFVAKTRKLKTSFKTIAKILIDAMLYPALACLALSLIQLLFICKEANLYQTFSLLLVNVGYMMFACYKFKEASKTLSVAFCLYAILFVIAQLLTLA